jgi:hypothetical protein
MDDPEIEKGNGGSGAIWRIRPSEHHGLAALESPIVFELADSFGSTFASVSIPTETVDELLRPHLSVFAELQLDGSVSLDSEIFPLFPTPPTDILKLARQALAPEMLRDEPNLKEQLSELRLKLAEALSLVDQTLANLDKPVA